MSYSRQFTNIRKFIRQSMKSWKVPGVALAIIKNGKVIFSEGFGYRDIKNKKKVTAQTIFAIASCSKAFTTMAMGVLADEKKLDWDKPVKEYMPEFRLFDSFSTERITPKDLVTHRSGLPRHDNVWYKSKLKRNELMKRLAYLEPTKDLRTLYQYNNLMFMAAGVLVEKISGMSWENFIQQKIFNPLNMKNSNCSVSETPKFPDYSLPYLQQKNKIKMIPFLDIDAIGPAGSINSCISDMSNWVLLHLNQGKFKKKIIISTDQIKQMHTPQMINSDPNPFSEMKFINYGLGWSVQSYRGYKMVTHGGSIDGFMSRTSFMPDAKIGVIALINLDSSPFAQIVTYKAFDVMLGLKSIDWNQRFKAEKRKSKNEENKKKRKIQRERKKGAKPTHSLKEYAGEFEHPGYGIAKVELKGNRLELIYNTIRFKSKHYHYDVFLFKNPEHESQLLVKYQLNTQGKIAQLSLPFENAGKEVIFTKKNG